jgi:hypothetical protein
MASAKLSKVIFNRTKEDIDFATDTELKDFLQVLKAKSNLPIKQMLTMLLTKQADMVSCSRDDTNYSFFAICNKKKVSIIVKKIGEEKIEFSIPYEEFTRIKA